MNSKINCIIVDLDGVMFDSTELEKHIPLENTREAWDKFQELYSIEGMCIPNELMSNLVWKMSEDNAIVFLTAREDISNIREITYNSIEDEDIKKCSQLIMRKANDYRPSDQVKEDLMIEHILPYLNPILAIDDSVDNIKMFDKYGIDTMLYKIGVHQKR